MKIFLTAILATATMFAFQNCTDATFDIEEASGTETLNVDDGQSTSSGTTTVVSPDTGSTVIPIDSGAEEIIVEVPGGQTEVLVQVPDMNGAEEIIITQPGFPIDIPFDGSWTQLPAESGQWMLQFPNMPADLSGCDDVNVACEYDNGPGGHNTFTMINGDANFDIQAYLIEMCTIDGVFNQEMFNNLSYSYQHQSTTTYYSVATTVRRVQILTHIDQQIVIPQGGGQILITVPEGATQFVLRLDGNGSQAIQVCAD